MKRLTQTAALVAAVLICVSGAVGLDLLRHHQNPSIPAAATEAQQTAYAGGPSCTPTYPRGLKIHGTKKHPIPLCVNGDLQSTWGTCVPRFRA